MFHHVSLVCVSLRNTQDFLSVVFREDSWKSRKKKPTPRKLRKRNGEREKQIEQKSSGFWQRLKWILGAKYCATWTVRAPKCCNYHGKWEVRTAKYCKMLLKWQFLAPKCPEYCSKGNGQDRRSKKNTKRKKKPNKPIPVPFPMDPMGSRMDAATGTGRRTNLRCLFALGRLRCMDLV